MRIHRDYNILEEKPVSFGKCLLGPDQAKQKQRFLIIPNIVSVEKGELF